jgi:HAD superfamily hydrolase (TIGR01490 family)
MVSSPPLAVFDFDHTLTERDSLLAFLFYTHGWWKASYHLITLGPAFLRYLVKHISRQQLKEKILTRFLGERSYDEVQLLGQRYAAEQLDHYLKAEAFQRLKWHQAQGHRCLIVSASPDFYLQSWARRHDVETVLGSRLELDAQGNITGRLVGLNCWGPEKERRLLEYLGDEKKSPLYMYGDSRGDQELLALADYPFYRKFS